MAISLLKNFIFCLHILIDKACEAFCSWLWPERKTCVDLKENTFITKSGTEVAEMIRKREVTVEKVVQAYIKRLNEVIVGLWITHSNLF